jgi:hypothetical protein
MAVHRHGRRRLFAGRKIEITPVYPEIIPFLPEYRLLLGSDTDHLKSRHSESPPHDLLIGGVYRGFGCDVKVHLDRVLLSVIGSHFPPDITDGAREEIRVRRQLRAEEGEFDTDPPGSEFIASSRRGDPPSALHR